MRICFLTGFWTRHSRCSQILQTYGDQNEHLAIACEHSTVGLIVSYFNKEKSIDFPRLCINEAGLKRIIEEKFLSVNVSLPSASELMTANENNSFSQGIRKLQDELSTGMVLIVVEQRCIHLFGLKLMVVPIHQRIEEMKSKYA